MEPYLRDQYWDPNKRSVLGFVIVPNSTPLRRDLSWDLQTTGDSLSDPRKRGGDELYKIRDRLEELYILGFDVRPAKK